MLPESHVAVIARNELWRGDAATEPFECGWAREAVFFVRVLEAGQSSPFLLAIAARVQISPDGMRWVDEGATTVIPAETDAIGFVRVAGFGHFLRLAAGVPQDGWAKVLVTLQLKA